MLTSVLNRLFSGRFLQRFWLIACFALLGAVCWFLGPWFGFGDVRPLAEQNPRILILVSLFLMLLLFWCRLPFFLSLALGIITAVWVIGPHILVGKGHPLEQLSYRLIAVGIVAVITLLYGVWRFMRALALNPALLDNFIKKQAVEVEDPIDHKAIMSVIASGVRYMQRIHRALPWWKRFFAGNQHRSWLPWFLVLGAPAAGKTAMLFCSEQEFPLPEQLNRQNKENPPTTHCECLYTNDALFLDTAGKYCQDDALASLEWASLVKALKKYRPVRGVNGVLVTLSVEDILHKSQSERLALASTLRSRLDDLRAQLGVHFPVYVTITKMDLLAGFEEFFRNLTTSEREQIWGITLPWEHQKPTQMGMLKDKLTEELLLLQERLSQAMHLRQQEEYNVVDRKQMYALPQDFGLLSQNLTEVVQNIFFASRYDETQFHPTLRGLYFLSNCQPHNVGLHSNSTLMQKWRNLISQTRPQTPASLVSRHDDEGLIGDTAWGKHYFLKALFSDVIARDRDLVSYNLQQQTRHRFRNLFGHLFSWGIAVWLCMALMTSYQLNRDYLQSLAGKLDILAGKVAHYITKPGVELLPAVLSGTQELDDYDDLYVENPEWDWRYGLYTGHAVAEGTDSLYRFFLQRYLLPQLEDQAKESLQTALQSGTDDQLWLALKRYLMISGVGKLDVKWLVTNTADAWEFSGAIRPYQHKSIFITHLTQLLVMPNWRQYGREPDSYLIKMAREKLVDKPESARIWALIKDSIGEDAPANLTLRSIMGSDTPLVFTLNDDDLLQRGIPGIFTREGWNTVVKKKILTLVLILQDEDRWVMGTRAPSPTPVALGEAVLVRYLEEYADNWQHFLNSVRLVSINGTQQDSVMSSAALDIALLRTLVADSSPLRTLFTRAVDETTLGTSQKDSNQIIDHEISQVRLLHNAQRVQQAMDFRQQQLIRQHLDDQFSGLRQFVRGEQSSGGKNGDFAQMQSTALSRVLGLLSAQYTRFVVYNSALSDAPVPPLGEESARIQAESASWPEPVRNIVSPLLLNSFEKIQQRSVEQSIASINDGPGEICRTTLAGKYPFAAESDKEVSLADFERFFSAGGVVDSWFKQNLAAKVDTSSYPWHFKGSNNSSGLEFFEQVERIRHIFFNEGEGRKMALNFTASVEFLSPSVTQFILNMDGIKLNYSHGPEMEQSLAWPGARRGSLISMIARKQPAAALPDHLWRGPWALFHWLDAADTIEESGDNRFLIGWNMGDQQVRLHVTGLGDDGMTPGELLSAFRCPEGNAPGAQ